MRAKRKETEKESNIRQGVHLSLSYGTSSTRCTKPSKISAVCVCDVTLSYDQCVYGCGCCSNGHCCCSDAHADVPVGDEGQ